jgi:hypothetical protein
MKKILWLLFFPALAIVARIEVILYPTATAKFMRDVADQIEKGNVK